jgi:cold shock CspA family protein/ribosome-associated translation inhibitor RaiA
MGTRLMQLPVQITFRGMRRSDALSQRIREKVAKLELFYRRVTSCRVTVEERHRHHHQGRQFCVRLDLRVPEHEIAINRDHDEDVYVALRDAFGAARRRLEEIARMQRGYVKAHAVPLRGTVARLFPDDGFGFIRTGDGQEYYFGRDNVIAPSFERLAAGDAVQFLPEAAGEGMQAKRVSAGKHGAGPAT